MKCLDLFAGIGGFALAARWMSWETTSWCEIDPFCQTALKYHFPNATGHSDIKTTDFTRYAGRINILTGGFPCQPYSSAGKRLGKEDDRHLWPEMLRAIREVSPRWIVGENVRGLTNWSQGLVFDEVQADLENEGYEVLPFLLPACAVDAPHRRDRIWFVAHKSGERCRKAWHGIDKQEKRDCRNGNEWPNTYAHGQRCGQFNVSAVPSESGFSHWVCNDEYASNTKVKRFQDRDAEPIRNRSYTSAERYCSVPNWRHFPTQPPVRCRNDGLSTGLAGITVARHRRESIKAYGNAIVPQVVFQIYKAIEQYENILFSK